MPQTPCLAGGAFNFGNKGATGGGGGGGGFGAKATGGFGFDPKGQRHPDRSFSFGKKGEAAHATGFGAKTATSKVDVASTAFAAAGFALNKGTNAFGNKAGIAFNFGNASAAGGGGKTIQAFAQHLGGGGGGFGLKEAAAPEASAMLRQRTPEDKTAFSFGKKATMGGFVFTHPTSKQGSKATKAGGKRPFGSFGRTVAASTRTTVDADVTGVVNRSSNTFAGKGHRFSFGNKPTSVGCGFSFGASKNKSA